MIDVHCHLLPGIDDGPSTLDESIALARIAVANGITHSILTPHIHPNRYENNAVSIVAAVTDFRSALAKAGIALQVGFAGEVRISPEILLMVQENQIPFYGEVDGYQILLLEMPHSHIPPGSDKLIQWLLDRKIRPMIAHPERNKAVMKQFDKIIPFIEAGCLLQLTAGSVAGTFGEAAQQTAVQLLETGQVTTLASDAHNANYRPPRLDHGRDAAAAIIGEKEANLLVLNNPIRFVAKQFADLAKTEKKKGKHKSTL